MRNKYRNTFNLKIQYIWKFSIPSKIHGQMNGINLNTPDVFLLMLDGIVSYLPPQGWVYLPSAQNTKCSLTYQPRVSTLTTFLTSSRSSLTLKYGYTDLQATHQRAKNCLKAFTTKRPAKRKLPSPIKETQSSGHV